MLRRTLLSLPFVGLALGAGTTAQAQDLASAAAISAAISGNTLRGHLAASGNFEEFYDPSGTVRGADYTGLWSVGPEGLCLSYDGDPASCWGLRLNGAQVIWVGRGGEEGSATLLPGNPNGF